MSRRAFGCGLRTVWQRSSSALCLVDSRGLAALLEQEQPRLFADQAAYLERFPADAGFDLTHGDLVRHQMILCVCAVSSNGLEFEPLRCLFCACSVQWRPRRLTEAAVWCSVPVQHRRRGAAAAAPPNPSRAGVRPGGASGRARVAPGPACCAGRRGGRGWSARALAPTFPAVDSSLLDSDVCVRGRLRHRRSTIGSLFMTLGRRMQQGG